MKLELKHIAPYLPYELKVKLLCGDGVFDKTSRLSVSLLYVYGISRIKPILRPLSQLTEEISHDNQCFTPIDTLDMDFLQFEYFHSNKGLDLSKVTYLDVVRLLSWHFDVFGLIEQGLAIEITTH
jgi:hypothetical protein